MNTAIPDLTDKVAVVTGATGGMGQIIAADLARAGAHVIIIARDPARIEPLAANRFEVVTGDLSRREDVRTAARMIADRHDRIHLLINNAGAHFPGHHVSADGIEMHIALDYLAAYGLMTLLDGPLRRGRARVVNVASDTLNDTRQVKLAGRPRPATLDLTGVDDLAQLNPVAGFVPFQAYARAKLMTVTAGHAVARDLAADGVTVNALHPGIVATDIIDDLIPVPMRPFRALIRRSLLTPAQGAQGTLRLATDPRLAGVTGGYFNRDIATTTPPVSHDPDTQRRLLALSERHFALERGLR
ncbi:SDR family NAD(P)-dependent oxidoreductase [Actinoplanes derwentensis]|uniref:NAD(P)-dependent dehydrogenase, short-chain alcohol dehydrogenase family n=1 Tax=Actinoplanes derwentensis TaxID=113562 RepID=A0A1H1UA02_9ACTN|nr:SDR family NAD(P)-dependent oxidoreductase [Actinoplanes derwentensis]GID85243.1 short-chain dehydrogenase [Actinoplanes derwentensis]SDS69290.1 NAD(P)-dependent dehydrogenase, short-chain alcohol dehydrogenase family [Actinoplanes derwentensis]